MPIGRLVKIDEAKRFAFVSSDYPPGPDVFLKLNELGRAGVSPIVGTPVAFEIGERAGRPCVVEIEALKRVADTDD